MNQEIAERRGYREVLVLVVLMTMSTVSVAGGATTSKLTMKGLKARANGEHAQAHIYLEQACDNGDPTGCFVKGVMFLESNGSVDDKQTARALFERACDGKNAAGCTNLAIMMASGDGGPEDHESARDLYKISCDAGQALACHNLAELYDQGLLESASDTDMVKALRVKACALGVELSC